MDIGVSGNFDEFLKSELARYKSTYAFREGFSDSDVQKICAYKQEENRQQRLLELTNKIKNQNDISIIESIYEKKLADKSILINELLKRIKTLTEELEKYKLKT